MPLILLVLISKEASQVFNDQLFAQGAVNYIIANVDDYASLVRMAKQATVVLDCVGPYRYW